MRPIFDEYIFRISENFTARQSFFFFAENDRGISKVVELLEFKSPMPENLFLEMVMNNLANEIKGNLILATFLF